MDGQAQTLGTASASPPLQRYHSFDSLRATMMLLGLVLHTAINYMTFPTGDTWPYKDAQTSPTFDILVAFIHSFRMPTFFVIAGFFAAFQYDARAVWWLAGSSPAGTGIVISA